MRKFLPISLALVLVSIPSRGEDPVLFGPLRIHDMSPLAILRMDMVPPHALNTVQRGWAMEFHYAQANLYMKSDVAEEFLEERDGTGPLTQEEARDLITRADDAFFFDGEVILAEIILTRAFTPRIQASVSVPYHHYGGGSLDPIVEWFHSAVGLDDAARDRVPRRRVQFINSGSGRVLLDTDGASGLGDATFTLRYGAPLSTRWRYVIEGAVRASTGREHLYFTSDTNYGLQVAIQRQSRRHGLYTSVSHVWAGKNHDVNIETGEVPGVAVGYEFALRPRTSLLLQAAWSSTDTSALSALTRDRTQLSLGVRRRHGSLVYSFALTENVIEFRNTPDIGFHFGAGWIIK